MIKVSISDTARLNNKANPNTLWEVIIGNIRNETIKYATNKKRKELLTEKKITEEIVNLETHIQQTSDLNTIEQINVELNSKRNILTEIIDKRINDSIIRAKAQYIKNNETKSKYFSSLEKKDHKEKSLDN